jgi:hypothetical protein
MVQEAQWVNLFGELYREWELDLFPQEQEIFLWNPMVEIKKIEQRRDPFQEYMEYCQG